jgi:hypothetical protein
MINPFSSSRFTTMRLTAAALALCAAATLPAAETLVGGIINKDTRWTVEKGPYIVTQDILVTKRGHLTIGIGTIVIIGKAKYLEPSIPQIDALDSVTISITIEGGLDCIGRMERRITFMPQNGGTGGPQWYGIVFKRAPDNYCELGYADISGAYNAVSVYGCSPEIHHCSMDYNNAGIVCGSRGDAHVVNCVVAHNFSTGIKVSYANPSIRNCIIAFNRNNGLWCDGASRIAFEYNCVFGNADGNLLDCDPELGVIKKKNDRKDSTDYRNNIFKNPIFAGSEYDSIAVERDVTLPTDRSRIKDTSLAKVLKPELSDSLASKKRAGHYMSYSLSRYSPCIRAASPSSDFKNIDGSRGDMGMYGSTRYTPRRK